MQVYSDGTTLKDHIDPELYQEVVEALTPLGTPEEQIASYKPWALANTFTALSMTDDTTSENAMALDLYVSAKASNVGVPVEGVETYAFQGKIFDDLSDEYQENYLAMALSMYLGMDAADMSRIPLSNNTGVAKLMAENGTFQVEYYNDDSHLGSSEQWRYPAAQSNAASGIPGMERNALRHRSLILPQEEDLYLNACTEAGIQPYNFLLGEPDSLLLSLLGERPAGVLQMDRAKEADQGAGWITLLWMAPEFQGKGLVVQLLGHAVCTYRAMGRQTLRLSCPPEFQRLRSFCLSHGFAPADGQPDMLEQYIGLEL